jgi:hypothetical protein
MADQKKPSDESVLSRLAGRGEDALTRLMDDLGRNPRVTDALARTMAAKGKVDETTRKTLGQVGLAAAGEIRDLRTQLERLEKRLEDLERGKASAPSRAVRKPATTTKSSGGTPKKDATSTGPRPRSSGGGSPGSSRGPGSSDAS